MEIKLKDTEIHHNLFIKEIEPLFMIQMFHNYQLKILVRKMFLIKYYLRAKTIKVFGYIKTPGSY